MHTFAGDAAQGDGAFPPDSVQLRSTLPVGALVLFVFFHRGVTTGCYHGLLPRATDVRISAPSTTSVHVRNVFNVLPDKAIPGTVCMGWFKHVTPIFFVSQECPHAIATRMSHVWYHADRREQQTVEEGCLLYTSPSPRD